MEVEIKNIVISGSAYLSRNLNKNVSMYEKYLKKFN